MRTVLILLIVFMLLFIVLFYPISVKSKTYFNLMKNKNYVYLKFGVFVMLCYLIEYSKGKFILTNTKGKTKELDISMPTKFQNAFIINLLKMQQFKSGFLVFKGGIKEDAFKTAILCGGVNSFLFLINNYTQNKYNAIINYKIDTNYKEDCLTFATDVSTKITLFSIIVALIKALLKAKGDLNGKRKKSYSKHFG